MSLFAGDKRASYLLSAAEKLNLTLRGTFSERQGEWLKPGTSRLHGTRPQAFRFANSMIMLSHGNVHQCSRTVCTLVIFGENVGICSYLIRLFVLALSLASLLS